MTPTRRSFLRLMGSSVPGGALGFEVLRSVAFGETSPAGAGLDLGVNQAGRPSRLTEPWYRRQIGRVQEGLRERGLRGAVVTSANNVDYLSGAFLASTERPAVLWVPREGDLSLFGPGLDRDMYRDWFIDDFEWYFDYPHAGPLNEIVARAGSRVDLWEWMLEEVAERDGGSGRIGVDRELPPSEHRKWSRTLPDAEFVPMGDLLLGMRMRKTEEEIVLTQVAIDYNDEALRFSRNLIAERGLELYDADVRRASQAHLEDRIFADYGQPTGRAHEWVGMTPTRMGCDVVRAGISTAYPHPNQYFHKKIERGDAIQISSIQRIGGYGGEGYRALHVEPIPDEARRIWEVHTEMTRAQVEHSAPGVECREVAEAVLRIAAREGMEEYMYHRPAHGEGVEGHQPPYISLGDDTVLEPGMMFSNEPGLYNLEGGYGYNHSNTVLITEDGARQMNATPLTKEFCWLTL